MNDKKEFKKEMYERFLFNKNGEKDDKIKYISEPLFFDNDVLWEVVYDGTNTKFVAWDGKNFQYESFFNVGENEIVVPIMDDSVTEKAVLLPEKPEKFDNIEELVKEIQEHIHKYCDVGKDFETFATYYILLSWIYDKLDTIPYLRVRGDTGTGKSRFLTVVGSLLYKASIVAGAVTPAPIYRIIKRWKGSIILDEADWEKSDEKNEVITILNCGFERNKPVIRCSKDNPDEIQFLPTFSPKLIATRQSFSDKALESRCISEIMKQTRRKDIPPLLPKKYYEESMKLRNKLLYFRLLYYDKINTENIEKIELGKNIEPRLKQAFLNFAVLFYNIPELFERFKKFIERYQTEIVEERSQSLDGQIVNTIFDMLGVTTVTEVTLYMESLLTCNQIAEKLKNDGWKVTPSIIGRRIKSLGLKTIPKKIEGKTQRIIDLNNDILQDLFIRYVPTPTKTNNNKIQENPYISVTSVTTVTEKKNDEWIEEIKPDGKRILRRK